MSISKHRRFDLPAMNTAADSPLHPPLPPRLRLTGEQLCSASVHPPVSRSGARERADAPERGGPGPEAAPLLQRLISGAGKGWSGMESGPLSPSQTPTPSPLPRPSRCPPQPPPPPSSPSSACQALQITTHANKSLETRTANTGLPWRPIPGARSPGAGLWLRCAVGRAGRANAPGRGEIRRSALRVLIPGLGPPPRARPCDPAVAPGGGGGGVGGSEPHPSQSPACTWRRWLC